MCIRSQFLKVTFFISGQAVARPISQVSPHPHQKMQFSTKTFSTLFCENISVEHIAKTLNVDAAYFSRKFSSDMEISPKKYIMQKRIERSKELLATTDAGIFEISNSVGYDDQFYFCRIFKKSVGITPSEYRIRQAQL